MPNFPEMFLGPNRDLNVNINIVHRFEFPPIPQTQLEALMSKLSDRIAELHKVTDEAIARVSQDVADLRAEIEELQGKVDDGLATDEDMAELADLRDKLAGLDPTKDQVLPVTAATQAVKPRHGEKRLGAENAPKRGRKKSGE